MLGRPELKQEGAPRCNLTHHSDNLRLPPVPVLDPRPIYEQIEVAEGPLPQGSPLTLYSPPESPARGEGSLDEDDPPILVPMEDVQGASNSLASVQMDAIEGNGLRDNEMRSEVRWGIMGRPCSESCMRNIWK